MEVAHPKSRSAMNLIEIRPPRIACLLLGFSTVVHLALRSYKLLVFRSYSGAAVLGAGGLVMMLWAWGLFRIRKTAICPTFCSSTLVTEGPYRVSRNPMYLGMTGMLGAVALALGTLPMFLTPVAFFVLMDRVFVPFEERKMAQQFGAPFEAYSRRVRRWF